MRVAVIGAGIVGVTTAHELACDGHEVTVFERCASVAAEASFAHAGLLGPAGVVLGPRTTLRPMQPWSPAWLGGMWRSWRAGAQTAQHERLAQLARDSIERMHALTTDLQLDYECQRGVTVLLRTPRELTRAQAGVKRLAELGITCQVIDGARARELEPGLRPDAPVHAALHLPNDEAGNCRQFAHLLKQQAQQRGTRFRFRREVLSIDPGAQPVVHHRALARFESTQLAGAEQPTTLPESEGSEEFDAVVVCAAMDSQRLLAPLKLKLPLVAVHGYSVTAPLRDGNEHGDPGPQTAVIDGKHQVTISRLGKRVRVAGGAEWGGSVHTNSEPALDRLYRVLDDWFPGCAMQAQAQSWKGARPMVPDGAPVIGASGLAGVWLNLGHGAHGWALACGSARVLADALASRPAAIGTEGFGMDRLRR